MSRLLFFLLLVANLAFGAHLWLTQPPAEPDFSRRERNRDAAQIVAVIPPVTAARRAEETRQQVQSLAGSACVEFAGIAPADLPQAREAFAAMQLGDRLTERKVEEITRHWVYIPPARDRRTAEQAMASLRRLGVSDLSMRPDNAISLGVFSTEDAARRYLVLVEAKGARGAQAGPFSREVKDSIFLVRDPDTQLIARLALLQREHANATMRAVACPAAEPVDAAAAAAPKAPPQAAPQAAQKAAPKAPPQAAKK